MLYDLVTGTEQFEIIDYRLPRKGEHYVCGRHAQMAWEDHTPERSSACLIVELRDPEPETIADLAYADTAINVTFDLDGLANKLEAAAEALRS